MNTLPEAENAAYEVLKKVLIGGAYSSVELDRTLDRVHEQHRSKTTALVYGVLDKSVALDYAVGRLTARPPKPALGVLLKLALYESLFGGTPVYAAANKYVSFAKTRMRGTEKFVNAVMRASTKLIFPEAGDDALSISVAYSRPEWLVKRMIGDLGAERTRSVIGAELPHLTHIRRNSIVISEKAFEDKINKFSGFLPSDRGYYVTRNTLKALSPDEFTAQSLSSMYAAEAYTAGLSGDLRILDLCAAPGGKSVYMSELLPKAKITACDIHPHRVKLIQAYSARMRSKNIEAVVNDAVKLRSEWINSFDLVVCDVPCTGSGLLCTSPDILLGKSDGDVERLTQVQRAILSAAAQYVRSGGRLVYSTCSLLKAENECVTNELATDDGFRPVTEESGKGSESDGKIRFFPDTDGCDGFYIARWTKR